MKKLDRVHPLPVVQTRYVENQEGQDLVLVHQIILEIPMKVADHNVL